MAPLTDSERRFVRRAVRRRKLFLSLSLIGIAAALALVAIYAVLTLYHHRLDLPPRVVIIVLVLLNARQNLRQYRYAGVLEKILQPSTNDP